MEFIFILSIIGFICLIAMFYIKYSLSRNEWRIHKSQVKKYCDSWIKGTMDDFIREFNKRDWRTEYQWKGSFFAPYIIPKTDNIVDKIKARTQFDELYKKNYIHADIIKFDGVGMILNYESYKKFKIWSYIYNGDKIIQKDSINSFKYTELGKIQKDINLGK